MYFHSHCINMSILIWIYLDSFYCNRLCFIDKGEFCTSFKSRLSLKKKTFLYLYFLCISIVIVYSINDWFILYVNCIKMPIICNAGGIQYCHFLKSMCCIICSLDRLTMLLITYIPLQLLLLLNLILVSQKVYFSLYKR